MSMPKILVLSASLRSGSFNSLLVALAAHYLEDHGASVTILDLGQFSLPIYDDAIEAQAIPAAAIGLHEQFAGHDGIFIASPEYNAFPSPLLLNALDWISRVKGATSVFERLVFALGAASPGAMGGYRGLATLRQKLELGLGAHVLPAMVSISTAHDAFDADGQFRSERNQNLLKRVSALLVGAAAGR